MRHYRHFVEASGFFLVLRIKTNTQNIQKSIIVNPAKSIIANLDVVVNLNVDVVKYQYYNYVAILARNIYFIHCTYIDAYVQSDLHIITLNGISMNFAPC